MSEEEIKTLLRDEVQGKKRANILIRLHQRFTTLRAARERMEILAEAQKP